MLLLLLIISPLAYLAIAFPNTAGLARQWWSTFLRYVIYGPVVLFILLGVAYSTQFVAGSLRDGTRIGAVHAEVLSAAVVVGGAIVAAKAGTFAGILGSTAALSLVRGGGQRLRGAAYRGGRATARGAYVGTGARGAVRQTRDFGKTARSAVREGAKQVPGLRAFVPAKRDEKGNLLRGQRSTGQRVGEFVFGATGIDRKAQERRRRRLQMSSAPATQDAVANDPAYAAGNLGLREVGESISKQQIQAVIDFSIAQGNYDRLQELVRNPYAVDQMSPAQKVQVGNLSTQNYRVDVDGNIVFDDNGEMIEDREMNRRIREIKTSLRRSVEETESDRW
jgi:hypothetical protein